ncbi:MAG: alpha/beta hydrolase family protein [Actinomycetota bacterium]
MKRAGVILLATVGLAGCFAPGGGGGGEPAPTTTTTTPSTSSCAAATETYTVTNPNGGAQLYVDVSRPTAGAAGDLPVVLLVPGGVGDSTVFTCRDNVAQQIADAGYVVVAFDPDGRGNSTGTEDEGGTIQQDGLAAVFEFGLTLDGVDADRAAIVTSSYGIAMGSGALVNHPDLPVDLLIDYEGPADRSDLGCHSDRCDEAYWGQREAVTFAAALAVPYVRVQSETDHAQADNEHALKMVNAAFTGGAPLVQLNDFVLTEELGAIPAGVLLPDSYDRRTAEVFVGYLDDLL